MKYCPSCKKNISKNLFTKLKTSKDGLTCYCGKCYSQKQTAWRRKHGITPKIKLGRKKCLQRLRKDVFALYGSKCSCCGETTHEFLTLDHINGGGNKHRKIRSYQQTFYDIRREGVANPTYRVLCYNCNCAIAYHKKCPHVFMI